MARQASQIKPGDRVQVQGLTGTPGNGTVEEVDQQANRVRVRLDPSGNGCSYIWWVDLTNVS
jgi:transcription antitermination factor NusG